MGATTGAVPPDNNGTSAPKFPPHSRPPGEPELSPTLSGIAAHCDPSLCGERVLRRVPYHRRSSRMPNRTATLVSAALSAGISLTASIGAIPARAADECLTAPKGETPGGSHWYYRIEHPSNRHCWYLSP